MGLRGDIKLHRMWLSLVLAILFLVCLGILFQVQITSAEDASWHVVGPYGGRVYALAIDHSNTTVVYAGTDNGVFKTTDSGLNWQQLGFLDKQIASIVIDYMATPDTVYIAGNWGIVSRSPDGGKSWEDMSDGISGEYIRVLATNPDQTGRLWAGTNNGVYKWDSQNEAWGRTSLISPTHEIVIRDGIVFAGTEQGIFETVDDGTNWESINGNLPSGTQERYISSIVIDPNNSEIIYIGTWYGGSYKTVDGGDHWVKMNTGLPAFTEIKDLVMDPNNSNILYATSYGFSAHSVDDSGIFKSTNGGGSWSRISSGVTNLYASSLDIHPTQGNIIYVGTLGGGVFRTSNGGGVWVSRINGLTALKINDFLETNNALYAATEFNGVYSSTDKGQTWQPFNNGLPPVTQFAYDLATDEEGNIFLAIGQQGVMHLDSGSWVTVTNQLSKTDVSAIIAISGTLIIATEELSPKNDQIFVSTDMGVTWTEQNNGLPGSLEITSLSVQRSGSKITIFASTTQGVYKSDLSPIVWSPSNTGISTNQIYDIAVDPNNSDILYAVACGSVYKSENSGILWEEYKNGLDSSCLQSLAINQTNSNRIYVGGNNGVYQSVDGGYFWSLVGADSFTNNKVEAITVLSDQSLLAGTTGGGLRTGLSTPATPPTPEPEVVWTVLVYLNGDNNLDRYTFDAFNNLERVADNPYIQIVALWDGNAPLQGDTREYLIQPDNNPFAISSDYELGVNYWEKGELDMGDPVTLANFVEDAQLKYPAEHYFLTIVDHGGGWSPKVPADLARTRWLAGGSGLSWDETNDSHYLATIDMKAVFEKIASSGQRLNVVFYDACLMSMFEEAYQIRNEVDYLVASENQAWALFPYHLYLNDLGPDTTPKQLATRIVDRYHSSLSDHPHTMAAIDLSRATEVKTALNDLSSALIDSLPASHVPISTTFASAQKFDYDNDLIISGKEGYVDLVDFAEKLTVEMPGTDVQSAAQTLLDTINDPFQPFIARERHNSAIAWFSNQYLDLDDANGISIYLPIGEADTEASHYVANQLDLATDTLWDDFIFTYMDQFPPQSSGRGDNQNNAMPLPLGASYDIYLPVIFR